MRDLWKTAKTALFVDNGLLLSVVLLMAVVGSFTLFITWGNAYDDLPAAQKAHIEKCALASRTDGPKFLVRHPECQDVASNAKSPDAR